MALTFQVPTIVCSGCVDTVTKAVQGLDGQAQVHVDLSTKMVTIETEAAEAAVKEAITATGHTIS